MARRLQTLPKLSELPLNPEDPPKSAWGLWGENKEASLGSLNYLTDEAALKAAKEEIQTGQRVSLDLPLDFFNPPLLGRAGFEQKVIDKDPLVVNDDVISFNTQGSSQWDSLRHFAFQKEKKFYNGVTQAEVHAGQRTAANGLQPWTKKGLAGRGVLIDFASYAEKNDISVSHFAHHPITLEDVKTVAKNQGISFREGDVLFLRTGYVKAYTALSPQEKVRVSGVKEWCGLGQSQQTTEWLWERQFAAVVSDSPGFEVRPPVEKEWHLHPILLAGWGTPIGELFDLEQLAELCSKLGRWTFFFTSAPLNYEGAVGSPPNSIAML